MANETYKLRYLPVFAQDLAQTVNYITNVLKNPEAAEKLVNDVETAILERLNNPLAFEPYPSVKKRKYPYYRILYPKLCGVLCCCWRSDGGSEISLWSQRYRTIFINMRVVEIASCIIETKATVRQTMKKAR